jgi:hypothetical protein
MTILLEPALAELPRGQQKRDGQEKAVDFEADVSWPKAPSESTRGNSWVTGASTLRPPP